MIYSLVSGFFLGGFVLLIGKIVDNTISAKSKKLVMDKSRELFEKGEKQVRKNLLLVSAPVYSLIYETCINKNIYWLTFEPGKWLAILGVQNIGYYCAHRLFHTYRKLYRFHQFHHKFDKILIPSIGNAVSTTEYLFAYMAPFAAGAYTTSPSELTFIMSLFVVALLNMSIHCIEMTKIKYPFFIVSPKKHFAHHIGREKHYAAPILDVDCIIGNNSVKE